MKKLFQTLSLAAVLCACFLPYANAAEVATNERGICYQACDGQHCRRQAQDCPRYGQDCDGNQGQYCQEHGKDCDGNHNRHRRGGCQK